MPKETTRPVNDGSHIRFRVTADDWAALADFQLVHSETLRRTVRRTQWLAVGLAIILAAVIGVLLRSVVIAIVAGGAGLFAAARTPRTVRQSQGKQARAMFDESFPPGSDTETRLEAREDGLSTESARGSGVVTWSAFTALAESDTHIYLGFGGTAGIVVPKDRVTEGDAARFFAALRRRIAVPSA